MGYVYYIQGVHSVRVELDRQGKWDDVERYDLSKQDFVSDWRMAKLIEKEHFKKVNAINFWEHIAINSYENVKLNIDPSLNRRDFQYFITQGFAVRLRHDYRNKRVTCERYDPYAHGFVKRWVLIAEIFNPELSTEVTCKSFWEFIAKSKYNVFSAN